MDGTLPTGASGEYGRGPFWVRWCSSERVDIQTNRFARPEDAAEQVRRWLARGTPRCEITMHPEVRAELRSNTVPL